VAAVWLAVVALAVAPAEAAPQPDAGPQPDAAPQAPVVAPDPAPSGGNETQPPPADEPASTAPTQTTGAPATGGSSPAPATSASKPARFTAAHKTRKRDEGKGGVAAAEAASRLPGAAAFRFKSLLPAASGGSDTPSHQVLIAAGALLALVLASGSLVSVSARAMKGQVR
jgi:hypothetical protein